jgi:hypothetical protein
VSESAGDFSEGAYLTHRATLSFVPLILLTMIFTVARVVLASHSRVLPEEWALLENLFQQLVLALWVSLDKQGRHLRLPFEFDAFVFFAWPIALPYYLVKSRGARGLLLAALVFALFVIPPIVVQVVRLLR